jgi:hypothetical protein
MAMEMHVLSERRLASIGEWQRAIDAAAYPLRLSSEVEFSNVCGLLPVTLNGEHSGFEIFHDDAKHVMQQYGGAHFLRPYRYALGFRWRGDLNELLAAWMAATAYANETGGVIFDQASGKTHSTKEAKKVVQQIEKNSALVGDVVRATVEKMTRARS